MDPFAIIGFTMAGGFRSSNLRFRFPIRYSRNVRMWDANIASLIIHGLFDRDFLIPKGVTPPQKSSIFALLAK